MAGLNGFREKSVHCKSKFVQMCHFISGVIDKQTSVDVVNQLGRDHAIAFDMCANDFVTSQLRIQEHYIVKKNKSCDCGTELGLLNRLEVPDTARIAKSEIDKLVNKGWSAGKIDRWKLEKSKTIEKDNLRYNKIANGNHQDIDNWMKYLTTLLTSKNVSFIGLFLHWYKGGLLTERIKVKDRVVIKTADLTPSDLLHMKEDVIYFIAN